VKRIRDHYQQSKQQYQAIADQEDTEMIDRVQVRVAHLDKEIQNLIDCCNNGKEVIEIEFDDVRRDCIIFAQQVETNRISGTQVVEGYDQQIRTLDLVLQEAPMGIDAIQDQSQPIIAGATEEFGKLKSRIEGCEKEQLQLNIKQESLTLTYNTLQKTVTDVEAFVTQGVPNYEELQVITDRINEIADQTSELIEAVAGAKFSNTTPGQRGRIE
jgi:hypothetical protein